MAETKKKTTAKKTAKKTPSPIIKKAKVEDKELQERLKKFIGLSLDEMMTTFKDLSVTKQWELLIQLLPYATPKMQATDINANVDYDPLSTQLGQLANTFTTPED